MIPYPKRERTFPPRPGTQSRPPGRDRGDPQPQGETVISLSEGTLLRRDGVDALYASMLDHPVGEADDTPVQVEIGGLRSSGTVLQADSIQIVIALTGAEDLPPAIPRAGLITRLDFLPQKLQERHELARSGDEPPASSGEPSSTRRAASCGSATTGTRSPTATRRFCSRTTSRASSPSTGGRARRSARSRRPRLLASTAILHHPHPDLLWPLPRRGVQRLRRGRGQHGPLPALFWALTRARRHAVIAGDFLQLPPVSFARPPRPSDWDAASTRSSGSPTSPGRARTRAPCCSTPSTACTRPSPASPTASSAPACSRAAPRWPSGLARGPAFPSPSSTPRGEAPDASVSPTGAGSTSTARTRPP